jgi:hypothetical protein
MFLVNLTLGQFAILLTSATAFLLALYLLDRARRRQIVPTLRFWVAAHQPAPVLHRKRIQQPWSLLLQFISIALLFLAISQLRWGAQAGSPRDHVLLLDTSAWMAARSGNRTLMDNARERAVAWARAVPGSDRILLVRTDALTTPAAALGASRASLEKSILDSQPGSTGLNLDQAIDFATRLLAQPGRRAGEIVYVGPGRVAESEISGVAIPPNLRVLRVADNIPNCGIQKIGLRRSAADPESWEIFVSAKNYGTAPRLVNLRLTFGGAIAGTGQLTLPANGEREATFNYRTRAAGLLRAVLSPPDAFPADDEAVVEVPKQPVVRITVYSDEPRPLRPFLGASSHVQAVYRRTADFRGNRDDGLVILDRFRPRERPVTHAIWIDPPADGSPVPVRTRVENAVFSGWRADHPLAAGLRATGFTLAGATVFQPREMDERVGETEGGPVIVARGGDVKTVVLGFYPAASGMQYELTTPLLFANILRWMYPEIFRRWELSGGSVGTIRLALDPDVDPSNVRVVREDGSPVAFTVRNRALEFFSGEPGTVRVLAGDREIIYSLTLPQIGQMKWDVPGTVRSGIPRYASSGPASKELWQWLAIAGALVLLLEWMLYGRLSRRLRLAKRPQLTTRSAS